MKKVISGGVVTQYEVYPTAIISLFLQKGLFLSDLVILVRLWLWLLFFFPFFADVDIFLMYCKISHFNLYYRLKLLNLIFEIDL